MPSQHEHRELAEKTMAVAIGHVERAQHAYADGDGETAAFNLSCAMVFSSLAQVGATLATVPEPTGSPCMAAGNPSACVLGSADQQDPLAGDIGWQG